MKNKQLRRVVVFLSCLSFILSLALPVFAEETTDNATFLTAALPADIVASSIFNGLGVLPGQNTSEYKSVVDRCVEYLIEQGKVLNGKIEVWQRQQVGDYSLWKYGVDVTMIDVIRSWLFNQGILSDTGPEFTYSHTYDIFGTTYNFASSVPFSVVLLWRPDPKSPTTKYEARTYAISRNAFSLDINGESVQNASVNYGYYYARLLGIYSGVLPFTNVTCPIFQVENPSDPSVIFSSAIPNDIVTQSDLTLGYVSPISTDFSNGYPEWYKNSIAVPLPGALPGTDDDVTIVPIAPGQSLDDTISIPQEDVWIGDGTITDNPAIPGTATLSDILAAVLSLPKSIVSSITEALSNFFGINGAADSFGISLTDFFPFCIPFDIYDFLSVLSAEPVAPVFHWELPVPQLGRTFEIDVDLSAWDPVAAVFRTFELLAFVVGLGMVTREKFLRS